MNFTQTHDIRLVLPKAALTRVFDECDGFDRDETGGRVIGTFEESGGKLTLHVNGIIEAGPQARRSPTSFFQDGEYQERIFRQIESTHPEIEHLGNWHTHHVNGLSHLSNGDISTYTRIVNHQKHNISFFYALLVVSKRKSDEPLNRYRLKHYIFRRNDQRIFEIAPKSIEIVDTPLVWPAPTAGHEDRIAGQDTPKAWPERAYDQDIIREFYEGIRPFTSKQIGLYWRGSIGLINGSDAELIVIEDSSSQSPTYSIVLREPTDILKSLAEDLADQEFPSARAALIQAERSCNRILYNHLSVLHDGKPTP